MEKILGFLAPVIIYLLIFILNSILPGKWVDGYITKPGSDEKVRYRLNGFTVFIVMILLYLILGHYKIVPFDWLYTYRWYGLAGACTAGLIFSAALVLPYPPVRKFFLTDLFLGRTQNMELRKGIDVKMWLYLAGAVMLGLNVLSFAYHHIMIFGFQTSPGIILSTALISFFVLDYLSFEEVHLYTYDIFAERVGFKLGWGCLVFYPYFYSIFLWSTVDLPDPHTPRWQLIIYVFIFLAGWILSRGANLQKFYFKKDPSKPFLSIMPVTISDGNKSLLVNGFWGLSRHINYLGEIFMATGIVLCTGYPGLLWPWLYPLYYVLLLVTRQIDDNKRCQLKYGQLWKEYKKRVPHRIIPGIY